jgi:hypothetical protein
MRLPAGVRRRPQSWRWPADTFRTTWFLATAIKNPSSAVTTTPAGVIGLVAGICQQARGD